MPESVDSQVGAVVVHLLAVGEGAVVDGVSDEAAMEAEVGEALAEDGHHHFLVGDFVDEEDPLLQSFVDWQD